ncbi:MAG TPA: ABC transporter permease, partial [Actinotalea sp.]|nr:ABC transporter permease [Actinotalea sp.]
ASSTGKAPVARPGLHGVSVGARRGVKEFAISLRNPEDLTFYLFWSLGAVVLLYLNRTSVLEPTELTLPQFALPGLLGAVVVFAGVVGPAFALVIEKEDGTLLRAKAAPGGIRGDGTGQVVLQSLGVLPMFALILVPAAFFVDSLMHHGVIGWLTVTAVLVLGLLAALPLGLMMGALARKPSQVTTWGLLPVFFLIGTSGLVVPIAAVWPWAQTLAQGFPVYWLGHVLRWAFLPDSAVVVELGSQWRVIKGLAVVGAWAVIGLLVAPRVLRRMARRESGSAVQARHQERMQRLG